MAPYPPPPQLEFKFILLRGFSKLLIFAYWGGGGGGYSRFVAAQQR